MRIAEIAQRKLAEYRLSKVEEAECQLAQRWCVIAIWVPTSADGDNRCKNPVGLASPWGITHLHCARHGAVMFASTEVSKA